MVVSEAPSIFTGNTFRLVDRIKIQSRTIREKDYIVFGRVSAIGFAAQRDTSGLSGSRPRYTNTNQVAAFSDAVARGLMTPHQADAMKPFSERQNYLWQSLTLDWLNEKRGPIIARSRDHRDWLLPQGLTRLPDIPDPRFVPRHAVSTCVHGVGGCSGCNAPRIPQLLTGCPVVGDRVEHKITARGGYVMGVVHPITFVSIFAWAPDGTTHLIKLQGAEDNVDRYKPALLIDDEWRAFFVGGVFV